MNTRLIICFLFGFTLLTACNKGGQYKTRANREIYKPLINESNVHDFLFHDSIADLLKQEYAFGSSKEKLYAYNYKNKQRVIVWELSGLEEISFDSVFTVFNNEECRNQKINPHSRVEFGNPNIIIFKTPHLYKATSINVIFSVMTDEVDVQRQDDSMILRGVFKNLCINSRDFMCKLELNFMNNPLPSELIIKKTNGSFYLIIREVMEGNTELEDVLKPFPGIS